MKIRYKTICDNLLVNHLRLIKMTDKAITVNGAAE
jgi:hypothetical protein